MVIEVSPAEFEELVAEALEAVPSELAALVDNVVFVIEADGPADDPDLLGLYEGVALTERGGTYANLYRLQFSGQIGPPTGGDDTPV